MKIETLPLSAVVPDPANVRLHDERNLDAIRGSLARFGQQKPIVVDSAGVIRAGNGTYLAAKALGWETIDVVRTGLEGLDATAFAIADNRTSDLSTFDDASLAKLLAELRAEDALDGVGFDEREIDELLAGLDLEGGGLVEDPGPQEPPETPVTRTGDLWLLGDHRLLCGDSTSAQDVERLMAGQRAHLLASDPPYLVDYDGTGHPQSSYNRPETRDKRWDAYKDPESSVAFFKGYLQLGLAHSVEDVPIYQWHATRRQVLVEQAWTDLGLLVHQTVIWVKSRAVLTRSMLMWRHEPCFFGWPQGNMPPKDRRPPPNETTVWEVDQVGQQDGIHPCLHPDALVLTEAGYRPISSVHVGERVLSADGCFHEVSHVSTHPYTSKELVCIVAKGGNISTLASDNHPFLIWRPRRQSRQILGGDVHWLRADKIQVGDYTMTPILAEVEVDPFPERDAEYWFLFGLYLAQGSLQGAGHGGQNRYPTFSLHKKRQDIVRRIRARWDSVGEYDPNDYGVAPSQGLTVMAFDPEAGAEFEALGGRGAGSKHLAPAIFRLPREKRMAVLEGWLNGDGCRVHNRDYWQGKTASPDLAAHLELLGESVGYRVSVFRYEPPAELGYIGDRQFKSQRPEHHLYFYSRNEVRKTDALIEYEGRQYTRRYVKRVDRIPYKGDVWNLSVDGCPTFQTAVGMSHNTQKPTQLFERPILWHTKPGEVCLEPFSGSGTQIIAAESTRRRCYAMEQSPGFVDAAVERWQKATGKEATLEGSGATFAAVATERALEAQQ